jgi:hypothetical protein
VARAAFLLALLLGCSVHARDTLAFDRDPVLALADTGGPRREVLERAIEAFECAGPIWSAPRLTVIDYSLPSTARRLWVLDLEAARVEFHELVAHGRGSGENRAVAFGNEEGSRRSSLGLFQTGRTYQGGHGYTLRLAGLEPGVNDRAEARRIVIHGAAYVSDEFARKHGRLGRSWGCPVLELAVTRNVIDRIRDGTALFVWHPDAAWLAGSRFFCQPDRRRPMP